MSQRVPYHTPGVLPDPAYDAVADILAEAWADGESLTVHEVILRGERRGFTRSLIRARIDAWRAVGVVAERPTAGYRTPLVVSFNATGMPVERATLRAGAAAFLADDGVPAALRRDAATALRVALAAPAYCSAEVLLSRCETARASDVPDLPARCGAALRADGQAASSVRNRMSSLRALLRHAAAGRRLPLVFAADEWIAAEGRYYPVDGLNKAERRRARRVRRELRAFPDLVAARRRELRAAGAWEGPAGPDRPVHPDDVGPAEAAELLLWLRRRGEFARAEGASMALDDWASRGFGPFRPDAGGRPGPRSGAGSSLALRLDTESSDTAESLGRLLLAAGFPAEWPEFLGWMERYHTLPQVEIEARPREYPARRPREHLRGATVSTRYEALRVYLGVAVARVGLPAGELTVARALGPCYNQIAAALAAYWGERASAGMVSSPFSPGLENVLIGAALLAGLARARLRLARLGATPGRAPAEVDCADDPFATTPTPADLVDDPGVPDTPEEAALASARRRALNQVRWVERRRVETVPNQNGATRKSLARLLSSLGPAPVEAVQANALRELEARARLGDDGRAFHDLCADVFVGGLVLSTAARAQELTHVRVDLQYASAYRPERMIALRGVDRKQGGRPHFVYLREAFLPRWAEVLYLERSRPALLARAPEGVRSGPEHPFLLVDSNGGAYGCVEEDEFGGGRAHRPWRRRVRNLSDRWRRFVGPRLFALGHEVPTDFAEFTIHAMRSRLANAMYRTHGLVEATQLLGDTPEVVIRAYVQLNARHADFEDPYGTRAAAGLAAGGAARTDATLPPGMRALADRIARTLAESLPFEEQRGLQSFALGENVVGTEEFWRGMDGLHRRSGRPAPLRPALSLVDGRPPLPSRAR